MPVLQVRLLDCLDFLSDFNAHAIDDAQQVLELIKQTCGNAQRGGRRRFRRGLRLLGRSSSCNFLVGCARVKTISSVLQHIFPVTPPVISLSFPVTISA
jgi:hypothetical protein